LEIIYKKRILVHWNSYAWIVMVDHKELSTRKMNDKGIALYTTVVMMQTGQYFWISQCV
jgi:hypothetical protein